MLTFTEYGSSSNCDALTRRGFLRAGALGALGLTLSDLAALEAKNAAGGSEDRRSVIMIFNLGAPSQLDTLDMKPDAPAEIRGPFRPIRTRSPDIQISELLPLHARIADRFSLVRSVHHSASAVHDAGHQMLQTGRLFNDGSSAPHAGCALSYLKGRRGALPAHVVLPGAMGSTGGKLPHGQDAGYLGRSHDPFVLAPGEIGVVRVDRRRRLRDVVDSTVADYEASQAAKLMDSDFASAFRRLTSVQAREAFDLSREPQRVRERYGDNRFGQSCLLARRLIEAGVRFVTINTFQTVFGEITWDIHGSAPFTSMQDMRDVVCPMYDRATTALIEDLADRGLLDETLVACLSEFGRTPRINPAGGRDHWPQCWTVYFAGGGVQGGRTVGRSDEIGAFPAERPTEPAEVVATIYRSLGLDLGATLPGPLGEPLPLVDKGVQAIEELF